MKPRETIIILNTVLSGWIIVSFEVCRLFIPREMAGGGLSGLCPSTAYWCVATNMGCGIINMLHCLLYMKERITIQINSPNGKCCLLYTARQSSRLSVASVNNIMDEKNLFLKWLQQLGVIIQFHVYRNC